MWDSRVHVGVAALIIDEHDRILVSKRGRDVSHGRGQISLPGGWIDYDETPEQAVVRECKEEIGVDVLVGSPVAVTSHTFLPPINTSVCIFYRAFIINDQIPSIMEADKMDSLFWTTAEELIDGERGELFSHFEDFLRNNW